MSLSHTWQTNMNKYLWKDKRAWCPAWALISYFYFRKVDGGFFEYVYEMKLEQFIFFRYIPYKYAIKKKEDDLLWENYQSSRSNNRLFYVEQNRVNKKGKTQFLLVFHCLCYATLQEKGGILFCLNVNWSVGLSIWLSHAGWFWWGHYPYWFVFTRSKVKVTRVTVKNVNMVSAHHLENYLSQSFHILHIDWSFLRHDPYRL